VLPLQQQETLPEAAAALAFCRLAREVPAQRWLALSPGLDPARVSRARCPFPERWRLRGCWCAQNWHRKGSGVAGRRQSDGAPLQGLRGQLSSSRGAGLQTQVSPVSPVMQDTAQNSPRSVRSNTACVSGSSLVWTLCLYTDSLPCQTALKFLILQLKIPQLGSPKSLPAGSASPCLGQD